MPQKVVVEEKKADWLPVVGIGLGVGAVGLGLYFYTKKPPGVSPGEKVRAHFAFDYLGEGGDYVLLIRFGYRRLPGWFDPEEGLIWDKEVNLPGPDTYEFDLDCVLPDGTPARTYDCEASILTPQMQPGQDWILRVFKDKCITVRKE